MSTPNPHNPYAPPAAAVADSAKPSGPARLANRATRFGAFTIDSTIGAITQIPMWAGAVKNFDLAAGYRNFLNGGAVVTFILALILTAVTIVLVQRNGQTIGKRILGIKVVRTNGDKATLGRIFWLRNVVLLVPTLIPYIGWIVELADSLMIFGETRQCLHDRIADTIVVRA